MAPNIKGYNKEGANIYDNKPYETHSAVKRPNAALCIRMRIATDNSKINNNNALSPSSKGYNKEGANICTKKHELGVLIDGRSMFKIQYGDLSISKFLQLVDNTVYV